jgi:hypothetical protein
MAASSRLADVFHAKVGLPVDDKVNIHAAEESNPGA